MKIDELTDRLLKEGVEKGNEEAKKIIADAQQQAQNIIENANKEAEHIKTQTNKELIEMRSTIKAELQLCASQVLGTLKTDITNMVCGKVVDENVKALETNTDFVCQIVAKIAEQMLTDGNLSIQTNHAAELTKYFEQNTKNLLNKGITIQASSGNKMKFVLVSEQKNYKLQFGEEELKEFFTSFLRQHIFDFLF